MYNRNSNDIVRVMDIIPGDIPRIKSWQDIREKIQNYPIFHHGPIDSSNIIDISSTNIILIRLNERPDVVQYSGFEGNHRLAYLVWRYGPDVKIKNFMFNPMYVSPGVVDTLKNLGCPDTYEDYAKIAESKLEKEQIRFR